MSHYFSWGLGLGIGEGMVCMFYGSMRENKGKGRTLNVLFMAMQNDRLDIS